MALTWKVMAVTLLSPVSVPMGCWMRPHGINGVAIADFGHHDQLSNAIGVALIQQTDGKLVAAGSHCVLDDAFYVARFNDNATSPGRIGLVTTLRYVAGSASVSYVVRRTGGRSGAVSVDYATVAGSAQPGSDLSPRPAH